MAEFLNTQKLRDYLSKIIETSEKELVIISPYIQTTDSFIELLKNAEKRGVETTLIYREKEVKDFEKNKFKNIDNLNLLHHPNIHCKLYYNEKYLIICSMNLYDYSQRNNREMGVLFRRTDEDATSWSDYKFSKDDESIFQDAIAEIKSIINGSEFEKDSRETRTIGFEMDIIKTNYDLVVERCNNYNKYSKNKKFIPFQSGEEWFCKCENFLDHVDLVFQNGKAKINLNFEEERLKKIYEKLTTKIFENDYRKIDCFRMYWTYHKSSISLYELVGNSVWEIENKDEFHQRLFIGLNEVFKTIKPVIDITKK
jgi:hypothetical protein